MNEPSPERVLRTDRLLLRPFEVDRRGAIGRTTLAARAIADTMISIPYPLSVHNAQSARSFALKRSGHQGPRQHLRSPCVNIRNNASARSRFGI